MTQPSDDWTPAFDQEDTEKLPANGICVSDEKPRFIQTEIDNYGFQEQKPNIRF